MSPLYAQIADALRARIASGEWPPGTKLPTEAELHKSFGAARNTVRRGLAQLVREGLVEARRPTGHFVAERTPLVPYDHQAADAQPAWHATPQIADAPAALAAAVGWQPPCACVVRRWVDHADDGLAPVHREVWWPLSIAEGTPLLRPRPDGTELELLTTAAAVTGQVYAEDAVTAVPVDGIVAAALGIRPGSAATAIRTVWRTARGPAIRVSLTTLPLGRAVTARRRLP